MASNDDVLAAIESLTSNVNMLVGQLQGQQKPSSAQQVLQNLSAGAQVLSSSGDDNMVSLFQLLIEELQELNVQLRVANRIQGGIVADPEMVVTAVRKKYKDEKEQQQRTPILIVQNR